MQHRNKVRDTRAARERKSFWRLPFFILWGLFLLGFAGAIFWEKMENERVMALFHQSELCGPQSQKKAQENCRETISAQLNDARMIESPKMPSRYGGGPHSGESSTADFSVMLPDGSINTFRVRWTGEYQLVDGEQLSAILFYLFHLNKGDELTVTRWRGKVISITTAVSTEIITMDHHANIEKARYGTITAVFGFLFVFLFGWSAYKAIWKRR